MLKLRPYQQEASNKAVEAINSSCNGLIVLPTGAGKSWVIADIANRIEQPVLVFCPSKEILQQNYEKMEIVSPRSSTMYSASVGRKDISKITFATIGSVNNQPQDFDHFRIVIVDEAHGINSSGGMYERFIHRIPGRVIIGLTATPFRLGRAFVGYSMLKFLTRTRPRIFSNLLYCVQVSDLVHQGYLSELKYYDLTSIDLSRVRSNSTGADYNDESLKAEYARTGFFDRLTTTVWRVIHPKSGIPRKGVLVFTKFIEEADALVAKLNQLGAKAALVTGNTPKQEREEILERFKKGEIRVVANVNCLAIGFDYPELDTVVIARPTKSLVFWYQAVGRCIRPYKGKNGWVIDLCGSYRRFGKVEDLKIDVEKPNSQRYCVKSNGVQLTNVPF